VIDESWGTGTCVPAGTVVAVVVGTTTGRVVVDGVGAGCELVDGDRVVEGVVTGAFDVPVCPDLGPTAAGWEGCEPPTTVSVTAAAATRTPRTIASGARRRNLPRLGRIESNRERGPPVTARDGVGGVG